MSLLKKLLGPAAIYGMASQVGMVITVLILPVVTPYLDRTDFGIVAIVMGYVGLFTVFQYLGLPIILSNSFFRHEHRYRHVFRSTMGFLHWWSIPYYSLIALLLYFICPPEARENVWIIIGVICLPPVLLGPVDTVGILLYQLRRKPQVILWVTLVTAIISGSVNVYSIVYLDAGYMGFIYATGAGVLVKKSLMHYVVTYREGMTPIWTVRTKYWKPRLAVSLPMVPHYYGAYLLNSSDRIVMDQIGVPTGNIGIYDGAGKFGNLFNAGSMAINKAVSPLMLEAYKKGDHRQVNYWGETFQVLMLAITFTMAMILPEVFPLLIRSPGMEAAIPIAIPIIMAYNYRGMYVTSVTVLFYNENTRPLLKISMSASIMNVILNVFCIYYFGFEVAAWTTFACYMYMGYSGFFLKEYRAAVERPVNWKLWLGLTCALTFAAYKLLTFSLLWRLSAIPVALVGLAILYVKLVNTKSAQVHV